MLSLTCSIARDLVKHYILIAPVANLKLLGTYVKTDLPEPAV